MRCDWDTPGTAQVDGVTDLVAEDRDFFLNEDGLLRIELLDTVNTETAPHGFWSGRFTITAEGGSTDAAVPEPATWAMMIAGFGAVGATLRRRRTAAAAAARVRCCDTLKNGRSLTA